MDVIIVWKGLIYSNGLRYGQDIGIIVIVTYLQKYVHFESHVVYH